MSVTNAQEVKEVGEVHRAKPLPAAEGQPIAARSTRYGGWLVESVVPTKHLLSDEGSYFVLTNPTPGTTVSYGAGAAGTNTFVDTTAFMVVKNNDVAGSPLAKRVFIDYLKVILNTPPTSGASVQVAVKIDNVNRAPTAGFTGPTAFVNDNIDDATGSVSQLWYPNAAGLTVPASGASVRLVSRGQLRPTAPVANDEFLLHFGTVDGMGYNPAATASRCVENAPPIVLGPQEYAVIYLWIPSGVTVAPLFEFELGLWER